MLRFALAACLCCLPISSIARAAEVTEFTLENGMQAVEMHEAGTFDLILMDVRMPVMSGPDATRLIRRMAGDKAAIPIIALKAEQAGGQP